jgi:hypothetical protein
MTSSSLSFLLDLFDNGKADFGLSASIQCPLRNGGPQDPFCISYNPLGTFIINLKVLPDDNKWNFAFSKLSGCPLVLRSEGFPFCSHASGGLTSVKLMQFFK